MSNATILNTTVGDISEVFFKESLSIIRDLVNILLTILRFSKVPFN